jgi:lysophospholipase L1-like esterase
MDQIMRALPPQTVIADMPYFGGGRYRRFEPHTVAASAIIHELAATHGLRVAPLHEITEQRDNLLTMASDLFHPSNRGYHNWYDAFKRGLGE